MNLQELTRKINNIQLELLNIKELIKESLKEEEIKDEGLKKYYNKRVRVKDSFEDEHFRGCTGTLSAPHMNFEGALGIKYDDSFGYGNIDIHEFDIIKDEVKIEIFQSEFYENPIAEDTGISVQFGKHRRYNFTSYSNYEFTDFGTLYHEVLADADSKNLGLIYKNIFMLDHSGLSFSLTPFSCPWDSMHIGAIWMTYELGKEEETNETFKSIWKVYKHYLEGDVWEIYDGEATHIHYGYYGEALAFAKEEYQNDEFTTYTFQEEF
jgi:hypothetical protein